MFKILGPGHFRKWLANGNIGHPESYWREHDIFLDCRGPLFINLDSIWGYNVTVITASHSLKSEDDFKHIFWPVIVEAKAWICSGALLYNCRIGEGAIVTAGTVVRSRDVPPWTMVEGNPAQIIADKGRTKWVYEKQPRPTAPHQQEPSDRQPGFMEDHETW